MAFVLDLEPTYKWPVNVEVPIDGRFRKFSFEAVFHRLPQSRVEEIMVAQNQAKIAAERMAPDLMDHLTTCRGHAAEVLAGWCGVKAKDSDAEDIHFTASAAEKLLEVPGMAMAVLGAFAESLGIGKEKN
jgi:hypothetical protein